MLQTVNQTATAVVLKDKTVERANIIAQRIGSLEIAIVKAMMLEQLDAKLADNQLAHIIFQKKNGSLREMWCSTNPSLCTTVGKENTVHFACLKHLVCRLDDRRIVVKV